MEPSETDTARLVAVTVAATVAVSAARAICPKKIERVIIASTPPHKDLGTKIFYKS